MKSESTTALNQTLISQLESISTFRILGGPRDRPEPDCSLLDEFQGTNEDSFSLESFFKMVVEASELSKDFILARVTTVDPRDRSKLYYSYYRAFDLNKVIFKSDPSLNTIVRMKALNPLNNMEIVGDVYYYHVKCDDFKHAVTEYASGSGQSSITSLASISSIDKPKHSRSFSLNTRRLWKSPDPLVIKVESIKNGYKEVPLSKAQVLQTISSKDLTTKASSATKFFIDAEFYATDYDFLTANPVRDYFKDNALKPEDNIVFPLEQRGLFDIPFATTSAFASSRQTTSKRLAEAGALTFICVVGLAGFLCSVILLPITFALIVSFVIIFVTISLAVGVIESSHIRLSFRNRFRSTGSLV